MQVLEIFPDKGYKNFKIGLIEGAKELKRKIYWMKKLRTIYPNSLNERARKHDNEVSV